MKFREESHFELEMKRYCGGFGGGSDDVDLPPIPEAPKVAETPKEADKTTLNASNEKNRKLAAAGMSKTNATSALGLNSSASTTQKTLLGQ